MRTRNFPVFTITCHFTLQEMKWDDVMSWCVDWCALHRLVLFQWTFSLQVDWLMGSSMTLMDACWYKRPGSIWGSRVLLLPVVCATFKTCNSKSKIRNTSCQTMMSNSIRRIANRKATQRFYHRAAPLCKEGKTINNPNDDEDDSPPIQTFNKSPIVQKLWKTRGEPCCRASTCLLQCLD